jgi:integrase
MQPAKQVMETVGSDRREAEAALHDRLRRVKREAYRKPAAMTFAHAFTGWFEATSVRKSWREATRRQYRIVEVRLLQEFGPLKLTAIRRADISNYVTQRSNEQAPATVSRDLTVLHSVFDWAIANELLDRNPAGGVPHPRNRQRRGHALRPETVQLLARSFATGADRAIFLTLVLTGIRRNELRSLRWRHVDLIENVLKVEDSKTETGERSIAISPLLAEELWQHRRATAFSGEDERVFGHPETGGPLDPADFRDALDSAFRKARFAKPEGFRPFHDLRVTAITNDALAGANPIAIMTKAGHANMATTKVYLKLAGVVFRDEAEQLERRLLGPSTQLSTHLASPEPISAHHTRLEMVVSPQGDA